MTEITKVVWREWYNEAAVKAMEKMGTLPRNEIELKASFDDGEEVAAFIAEKANEQDFETFREGGLIVILEPEEFAGEYDIEVEYRLTFYANAR